MAARLLLPLLICLSMVAETCIADNKKAGNNSLSRVEQKLRQVQQEKSQLMRENEQLAQEKVATEAQLKDALEKLNAARRKVSGMSTSAGILANELESVKADRAALKVKLAATERQFEDTTTKLRANETERARLEAVGGRQQETMAGQKAIIGVCESNNSKLFQYGSELLDKYQHKSCSDALLQAEPFTGLKRVEIENMMEDYRDKLNEQRFPMEGKMVLPAENK